jgi:hypothetical protein
MKALLIAAFIYHSFGWMLFFAGMGLGVYGLYRYRIAHLRLASLRTAEHDAIVDRAWAENDLVLRGDPMGVEGQYTSVTLPQTFIGPKVDWSGIIQSPDYQEWYDYKQRDVC